MIRKILAVLLTFVILCSFAACSSETKSEDMTKYTAHEIMDRVSSSMTDLGDMKKTDKTSDEWLNIMAYVTDIPEDKVLDIEYLYKTDSSAEELCCIITADTDSAKKVQSDMEHRIEVQRSYFETYNTEELSKLDGACALRSGNACIMLIGSQAQNGKFEFDKMMAE